MKYHRPKYQRSERIESVSVCTPGVRLVRVLLFKGDDDSWEHIVKPVIAIESRLVTEYTILRSEEGIYDLPSNPEENGWDYSGRINSIRPVVIGSETGDLVPSDSYEEEDDCSNSTYQIIALPWPYDPIQDEEEIQKHIPALKRRVEEKLKKQTEPKS